MSILTEQIQLNALGVNDIVHIARPTDLSQGPNGSSYKATIGQLIDAENCCLTNGFFDSSLGNLNFSGISNQFEFSVTGITIFSGGSGDCINNLYVNNIWPCLTNLNVQPNGVNGEDTFFGQNSGFDGFQVRHTNAYSLSANITKLGLNTGTNNINQYSSFEFFSFNKLTSLRFYDNLSGVSPLYFPNFQEVISISYNATTSVAMTVESNNECGLIIGSISIFDTSNNQYGNSGDGFISTIYSANGINFISQSDTIAGGHIRFFAGTSPGNSGVLDNSHIEIRGNDPVKGFTRVGFSNSTATSNLDIFAAATGSWQSAFGYTQLRLRTPFTPAGQKDPLGETGDIAWDDDYFYVKISNIPAGNNWWRILLSTF